MKKGKVLKIPFSSIQNMRKVMMAIERMTAYNNIGLIVFYSLNSFC